MTTPDILNHLTSTAALAEQLNDIVARTVDQAREEGATWDDIGAALGLSRQGAFYRYGRARQP